MKVKSFTYERNWTGKYYRQRLLPSMQTTTVRLNFRAVDLTH
jgi:hypothetical protein